MSDPQPDAPAPQDGPLVMPADEFETVRRVAASVPDAITRAELAEALDSGQFGLNSSFVGGRELAVNVFAWLAERKAPESTERPAAVPVADDASRIRLCPTCLHDGVLERILDRALAAEAKLAGVRDVLLEGGQDSGTVRRRAIAIIASSDENEGGASYDRDFTGPVL